MYSIEDSIEISDRIDFSLLCNARNLRLAMEIGTDRGIFAKQFLQKWQGNDLWCVDPYEPYEELVYDRSGDMIMAMAQVKEFADRVRFIRARSPDYASKLPLWFKPQFIYIDGSHLYESAIADINGWWPILPDEGILAGHDYSKTHSGVIKAVKEFAKTNDLVVRLTSEEHNPDHSWYIYKKEPKELIQRFFRTGNVPNPYHRGN